MMLDTAMRGRSRFFVAAFAAVSLATGAFSALAAPASSAAGLVIRVK